jgi:dihydropteroate synthase
MGFNIRWSKYGLNLDERTHVMGVLNVTPDSFSDGGLHFERDKAVAQGLRMAQAGADIIDVGGESTRPYAGRVSSREEMDRVLPVIEALHKAVSIPISIDTTKSDVARAALAAGASMINDISAFRSDPGLVRVAAEAEVPVVLMHMKGTPETMQDSPTYADVVSEICAFLEEAVTRAVRGGVREDRIIIDPGIGFGKTFDHNLVLIRDLSRFGSLGRPILLGSSNKGFIGRVLGKEVQDRAVGTMATVAVGVMNGAHIVRVHNVPMAVDTVRMVDAIKRGRVRPVDINLCVP